MDEFLQQLGCQRTAKVKVVSIFGNTGDGKSHTLNHTFFNGREVEIQTQSSIEYVTIYTLRLHMYFQWVFLSRFFTYRIVPNFRGAKFSCF